MSNGQAPEGWDGDVPPELVQGAMELRKVYIALLGAGFTTVEAAAIIAAMLKANEGPARST